MSSLKWNLALNKNSLDISRVHTVVFDFDGVFTDNQVYVDSSGNELVKCSRADSYGLDLLRKSAAKRMIDFFVLTTESNSVVLKRCQKMGIDCFDSQSNKQSFLEGWLKKNRADFENSLLGVAYFGNDLNDLEVMSRVGISFAPADAHPSIKKVATFVLNSTGGSGFVREGIELLLGIQKMSVEEVRDFISNS